MAIIYEVNNDIAGEMSITSQQFFHVLFTEAELLEEDKIAIC